MSKGLDKFKANKQTNRDCYDKYQLFLLINVSLLLCKYLHVTNNEKDILVGFKQCFTFKRLNVEKLIQD